MEDDSDEEEGGADADVGTGDDGDVDVDSGDADSDDTSYSDAETVELPHTSIHIADGEMHFDTAHGEAVTIPSPAGAVLNPLWRLAHQPAHDPPP